MQIEIKIDPSCTEPKVIGTRPIIPRLAKRRKK